MISIPFSEDRCRLPNHKTPQQKPGFCKRTGLGLLRIRKPPAAGRSLMN
jgi:hypothetical protein